MKTTNTTNTTNNKSEKIGDIISTIFTIAFCSLFLTGISYFIYNFVSTIITGGSFNI